MNRMHITFFLIAALCLQQPVFGKDQEEQNINSTASFSKDTLRIRSGGHSVLFHIEIAETPQQQEVGLMFRHSLPPDSGMLFINEADRDMPMWMKNTLIPLDMLFIDQHGRIDYIAENAQPNSLAIITSGHPERAVLELAGGASARLHLHTGDSVQQRFFTP